MSPEESTAPHSDGIEPALTADMLRARQAALRERYARLLQERRDLAAEIDQLEADADELEESRRQLRARVDAARESLNAQRAAIKKPRKNLWPWAMPIALCIMVAGNTMLAISDFVPASVHARGTSFALVMTAYFITGLALARSMRGKR